MMPDWIRIPMEDLKPHPMNAEVYGPDAFDIKMMESIRKHGVLEPLVVTRENVIVSGHRRWAAAMKLLPAGSGLPCRVEEFEDELAEQEALIAHNLQREKTFSQRMAEGQVLDRIEYERSKRRQGTRTDIPAILPEGYEPGETREKVAAKIGMGARTYGKAKKVVEAAEAGDEKAREAVQKIDAGEMSVDRAYKAVTGKASVVIQIFPVVSPTATEWHAATHLNGEMPAVGERALAHIRDLQAREVLLDRVLYNHSLVSVENLETQVTKAGGTLPSVEASEPEPEEAACDAERVEVPAPVQSSVVIPAEVLAIGPDEQVTIAAWYLYEGLEKPERTHCYQPPKEGVDAILRMTRVLKNMHPDATFPKFKIGAHEVSREVMEALRAWGRMLPEETEHTISVYYSTGGVPHVRFFDGLPVEAAQDAVQWVRAAEADLRVPGTYFGVRRIHFADGAGGDMDVSRKGLERLAMPAPEPDPDDGPISTGSPGVCCPDNRLGRDGRCTGCGKVLLPELQSRYLHLLRDEIEATLQFSKYPYDGVRIVNICGGHVVVVVPRSGDLPTALVAHLMGEAAE